MRIRPRRPQRSSRCGGRGRQVPMPTDVAAAPSEPEAAWLALAHGGPPRGAGTDERPAPPRRSIATNEGCFAATLSGMAGRVEQVVPADSLEACAMRPGSRPAAMRSTRSLHGDRESETRLLLQREADAAPRERESTRRTGRRRSPRCRRSPWRNGRLPLASVDRVLVSLRNGRRAEDLRLTCAVLATVESRTEVTEAPSFKQCCVRARRGGEWDRGPRRCGCHARVATAHRARGAGAGNHRSWSGSGKPLRCAPGPMGIRDAPRRNPELAAA